MVDLPTPDPGQVPEPELHAMLVKAYLDSRLERERANAAIALEEFKAGAAQALEEFKADAASQLEAQKEQIASSKARLDRELGEAKEENDADIAYQKSEHDKELELRGAYHQKMAEVAAGAIERARDSAKFVQTAAAALITAYAALLALVFSVEGAPLPVRGTYAAVFLGLAIAFAIGYLAFIKAQKPTKAYEPGASIPETQLTRTASFIEWINAAVSNRRTALRASVLAFGFGVAFIPAAFIGPTGGATATTADAPTPPPIPAQVAESVETDAVRLYKQQVDAYLTAVNQEPAADDVSCTALLKTFSSCAWTTEDGVERVFRRLAILAALVLLIVPLSIVVIEKRARHHGTTGTIPVPVGRGS